MDPETVKESLLAVSDYIDGEDSPSLDVVEWGLRGIMDLLSDPPSRAQDGDGP